MMISKIAPDDGDVGPTPPLPAALEDEGQTTSIFSDISSQLNGIKILLPPSITASKSQSSAANDEFHRHALPWNRATGGTPAAIALPRTDSDVARVVRYAAEKGLGLCVAGGKHSLYASIDGIIQLNLEGLRGVTIDRQAMTATVLGGTRLRELDAALQPHNLATPVGTNPDTGVTGLMLGGGVGYLSRRFGMTIDQVVSVKICLASGEIVTASDVSHPSLFWAIRGGGGNFGVVLSTTLKVHDIGPKVLGGAMVYPNVAPLRFLRLVTHPKMALFKHRDYWMSGGGSSSSKTNNIGIGGDGGDGQGVLTDDMGMIGVLQAKGTFVSIYCYSSSPSSSFSLSKGSSQLKSANLPYTIINTIKPTSYHSTIQPAAEKEQREGYYFEKSVLVTGLPDAVLEILWAAVMRAPLKTCSVLIMPLGGAISRPLTDATAFYYRHASVWLIIMTKYVKDSSSNNKESPSLVQKKLDGIQWVKGLIGELKPWICGVYQALGEVEGVDAGDICETGVAARTKLGDGLSVYGENQARLEAVKLEYDAGNMFRFNRNIAPSTVKKD